MHMEKLKFTPSTDYESEEPVEFFVLDQTRINGTDYLLVTDTDDEEADAEAWILKDTSAPEDTEAVYVILDEEEGEEFDSVAAVFEEQLADEATLES